MDAYQITEWVNHSSPPINATNLLKIETAIKSIHDALYLLAGNNTTFRVGSENDYTEFESDGTVRFHNNATVFLDELNDLTRTGKNTPSDDIVQNLDEGVVAYKTTATLNDWCLTNIQINHDWKSGTEIEPHIHWFQTENNNPHWLIGYRWQRNGQVKTENWTYKNWSSHAYNYSAGNLCQITSFGNIAAPSNYSVSDIFQLKIFRDSTNASNLFSGNDAYTGNAVASSIDCHIEVDTIGSRQRYFK